MTGDGDACHMGLSISDAQTVSFATNQLDLDYLEHGPATVLHHMEWVERLQRLHASGKLDGWLEHLVDFGLLESELSGVHSKIFIGLDIRHICVVID
jgi:hypothetical protein